MTDTKELLAKIDHNRLQLRASPVAIDALKALGISGATAAKHGIGYDSQRQAFTLPIVSEGGEVLCLAIVPAFDANGGTTSLSVCPNESNDLHQCITNGIAWLARAYQLGDPDFRAQRIEDAVLVDAGVEAGTCTIVATVDMLAKTVQWTARFDDGRTCDLFSQGLIPDDPAH